MFFSNLTPFSIGIFLFLLLFVGGVLFQVLKKKQHYFSYLFLLVSFLFLLINIFEIKGMSIGNSSDVEQGKIAFVLDVSKSMEVTDVGGKKDSRLGISKEFIHEYLDNNGSNTFSLFAFAGETLELLPFTSERGIYKTILAGVDKSNLSKNGSNFSELFIRLQQFFTKENSDSLIVIFTDGGDDASIHLNNFSKKELEKNNTTIILVGVGTSLGGYIPDGVDVFGRKKYKLYNGEKVVSGLNSSALKKLAEKYDFEYISLESESNFNILEDQINNKGVKISTEILDNKRKDLTYIFIFLSLIFFSLSLITHSFYEKK